MRLHRALGVLSAGSRLLGLGCALKPPIGRLLVKAYSTVWFAASVLLCVKALRSSTGNHLVVHAAGILTDAGAAAAMGCAHFAYIVGARKASELTDRLVRADRALAAAGAPPVYRRATLLSGLQLVFGGVVAVGGAVTHWLAGGAAPLYIIPEVISLTYHSYACFCLSAMKAQYQAINRLLEALDLGAARPVAKGSMPPADPLAALYRCRRLHRSVSETSITFNDFHSAPLLFSVAAEFVAVFSSLYFMLFGYPIEDKVTSPSSPLGLSTPLLRLTVAAGKLGIRSVLCQRCADEAAHSAVLVHKVSAGHSQRQLRAQLSEFSLQLLHWPIRFTACGLFAIDCTLLHTVAAAVTIYLVILIQFDMATKGMS